MSDMLKANEPRFFFRIGPPTEEPDSHGFEVVGFHGTEGISELYQYKIDLCTDERAIDFSAIVGKDATFWIWRRTRAWSAMSAASSGSWS